MSAQTVWQILDAGGLPRLPRRDDGRRGPPARLDPVKAAALPGWPGGLLDLPCDHAGLLLLFPAICDVGLPDLISQAGYPSTRELSSWQSIGTLLLAKCARKPRVSHAGTLADDAGLAFALGLTALPKTTHLGTYSWRIRREANRSSPPTRSSTSCPAAASAGSPCASAARPSSPAWTPCPPPPGNPPSSPGPAATGGPACTKT